jgi:hypothetical protein
LKAAWLADAVAKMDKKKAAASVQKKANPQKEASAQKKKQKS